MTDTTGLDRALGAIGTTFRLTRLYPPTHPAVQEALRQVGEALPPLAAVGTVEWKVGATRPLPTRPPERFPRRPRRRRNPPPPPPRTRSWRRSGPAPRFGPTRSRPTWRRRAPWRRYAPPPGRSSSAPRSNGWRRWRPS